MSERPLEPARHDPTAAQAVARADRGATTPHRPVRAITYRPPSVAAPPIEDATMEELIARRNALRLSLSATYDQLQACSHAERALLLDRKVAIERTLMGIKARITQCHAAQEGAPNPIRRAARDTIMAADNAELLYRMYLMFQHFTGDEAHTQMRVEHKRFLIGVKELLKEKGYSTRKPGQGDPLEGFIEKTEAA